mgnify:CR=1 FL=1
MGKKGYIAVLILCFFIIASGILTVCSNLPKAIKDNSPYKINFSLYPFSFEYDNVKYKISAGGDTLENIVERFSSVVK